MTIQEKDKAFVVSQSIYRPDGRGHNIPLAICRKEATAIRVCKMKGDQGAANCSIEEIEIFRYDTRFGKWYGPIDLLDSTFEDDAFQNKIYAKNLARKKATDAGLTEEDIKALSA